MTAPAWTNPALDQRIIDALVCNAGFRLPELTQRGISEESIRAYARELGLTDRIIKESRLAGTRPAMRLCMKCDLRFLSSGIHNRLCRRCVPR
ncbi:MAG: hypothetical protein PVI30_25020 [Myxococcales bacterium]